VTIHLSIILFLPLAAGVLSLFAPARIGKWVVFAATMGVFAYAVALIVDFDRGAGLQYVTDDGWISELGIRYSLGIDGLNLFLVAMTAALWPGATYLAAKRGYERPDLFFFHIGLAETAVLGAFLAQDLALFVLFFDLMLVPFYFLIGTWGEGPRRVAATTKFVIYTLVGSLLMLAGAIALGVLATPEGGEISYSIAELAKRPLEAGSQYWIFWLFAIAFLIKAPVFPLHGWMPDTYRATPLPVLVLVGAVIAKVGSYAFLKIVLPILPDAAQHFQEIMIVIAVVAILYGSVLAFSQDEARLVVGYSSISQLGFITLGIFALDPKGAQGALLQMVTHALAAGALFMIVAVLSQRTKDGTESLSKLGGIAFRAPVLAAVFLIVALATLAMPGSPNFVGEILILFGAFEDKLVYGLVASAGVAFAAVYSIRFFQAAMHHRVGDDVTLDKGDLCLLDFGTIVPLAAIVVGLGVYPQFVLGRTDESAQAAIKSAQTLADRSGEAQAAPAPAAPVPQQLPPQAVPPPSGAPGEAPPQPVPEAVPVQPVPEGAVPP